MRRIDSRTVEFTTRAEQVADDYLDQEFSKGKGYQDAAYSALDGAAATCGEPVGSFSVEFVEYLSDGTLTLVDGALHRLPLSTGNESGSVSLHYMAVALLVLNIALASVGFSIVAAHAAPPEGLSLTRHGVVISSSLPHCAEEDGSGSVPAPCTWNVGTPIDGNGIGLAYWFGVHGKQHFVWAYDPTGSGWRWLTKRERHNLHRTGEARRSWKRCVVNYGSDGRIKCPNGDRYTVS